jgi:hypothetical protein
VQRVADRLGPVQEQVTADPAHRVVHDEVPGAVLTGDQQRQPVRHVPPRKRPAHPGGEQARRYGHQRVGQHPTGQPPPAIEHGRRHDQHRQPGPAQGYRMQMPRPQRRNQGCGQCRTGKQRRRQNEPVHDCAAAP